MKTFLSMSFGSESAQSDLGACAAFQIVVAVFEATIPSDEPSVFATSYSLVGVACCRRASDREAYRHGAFS